MFDLADSYTYTVTCEEDEPGFCGSGLNELSKAGGLMRRVARPPCRGCNGVGRSSFSNTEENSSPRTFKVKQNRGLINNRKEASTGEFTIRKSPKTGSKTAVYSFVSLSGRLKKPGFRLKHLHFLKSYFEKN